MSLAIAIPLGVAFAVLAAVMFSAIEVSGRISRGEEADEVDFLFSVNTAVLNSTSTAPPWSEVSKVLNNREEFCSGCPEYGHCDRATMVYTHGYDSYPWFCLERGRRK